jgi:hypothetical protein
MNISGPNQVDESRAAMLLGMPPQEIRRLSRLSGLGRVEKHEEAETLYFTYEELRKICMLAIPASE